MRWRCSRSPWLGSRQCWLCLFRMINFTSSSRSMIESMTLSISCDLSVIWKLRTILPTTDRCYPKLQNITQGQVLSQKLSSIQTYKLFIRCSLQPTYASDGNLRALMQYATVALELPSNVSYRIQNESSDRISIAENPREGFVCSTRWRLPGDDQSVQAELCPSHVLELHSLNSTATRAA